LGPGVSAVSLVVLTAPAAWRCWRRCAGPRRARVIQTSSKPKNGATKSLHNRSPPKPISQPPLTTSQMLVSLSKNGPATNSHRPVATIATTITNRRALRIDSWTVCTDVLEIDVAEHLPGGVADDETRRVLVDHSRVRESRRAARSGELTSVEESAGQGLLRYCGRDTLAMLCVP
jgi:hypothetical protein